MKQGKRETKGHTEKIHKNTLFWGGKQGFFKQTQRQGNKKQQKKQKTKKKTKTNKIRRV